MTAMPASPASRSMAAGVLAGCRFMADFFIGSGPDWIRLIADDPVERSQFFVAGPLDRKTPLAKSRHRGSSRVRQPARRLDQGGERRALVLRQHRDNERQAHNASGC